MWGSVTHVRGSVPACEVVSRTYVEVCGNAHTCSGVHEKIDRRMGNIVHSS